MGNFFTQLLEYKRRKDETPSDQQIAPKGKQSRRWKMMNSTFEWKCALALFIFLSLFVVNAYAEEPAKSPDEAVRVPIIMYHLVTENGKYIGKYGIRPSELKSDLEYLRDNGYTTIVMQDLINFVESGKSLPEKPVVLTFDDGNSSDHKYLLPLLQEFNMKAVASILGKTTDKITKEQTETPNAKYPNLTWGQVIELHKSGLVEIQSHSFDLHGKAGSGKLNRESSEEYHQRLKADLQKLQDQCQEHIGIKPTTFCYPLGVISKGSQAVLEELGFVASLSCQERMNFIRQGDKEGLFKLNRVNRASGRTIGSILEKLEKEVQKEA